MSSANLLIWADCGPEIGSGHVMRCAAIAAAASAQGIAVMLATRTPEAAVLGIWREIGVEIKAFKPDHQGAEARLALEMLAQSGNANLLLIDRYNLNPSFWQAGSMPLMAIDDEGQIDPSSALVVNPGLGSEHHFPHAYPSASVRLFGADYALVRPQVLAVERRGGKGILLTLGGSDVAQETLELAIEVANACPDSKVNILCETHQSGALPVNLDCHPPGDLAPHLAGCDIIITGGGVSAIEAAYLGIPMILTIRAENQRYNAEYLAKAGGAVLVESLDDLASTAAALLSDKDRCAALARSAKTLIDGRGATRIMQAIIAQKMHSSSRKGHL